MIANYALLKHVLLLLKPKSTFSCLARWRKEFLRELAAKVVAENEDDEGILLACASLEAKEEKEK